MPVYAHDSSFFSRRAIVFVVIVGLHVLLAYMLASGLARKIVEVIAPPIVTDIIEEVQQREEPPPPPPPEFERPKVEVPLPEVTIDVPMDAPRTITDITTKPVPKAPPRPPAPRSMTKARMGKNFPNSEEFYPSASKRLEEEGTAAVHVCVGPSGKLAEAPRIEQSSKSARLDEAAIKLARAGRYIAGAVDGVPTTDCFSFRVKFELKK